MNSRTLGPILAMLLLMLGPDAFAQDESRSESIRQATIQLFEAVENHDVEAARTALDNGADVNGVAKGHPAGGDFHEHTDTGPVTPLIAAFDQSPNGQKSVDPVVKLLVSHGADLNFADGVHPPIVHAREQPAHLKYLLGRGANPDPRFTEVTPPSETEQTLLHWAAGCCPGVARMLLQHGANPDATASGHGGDGGYEFTPFREAYPEHPQIAEMLFRYGHSPFTTVYYSYTPARQVLTTEASALELVAEGERSATETQRWLDLVEQARRGDLGCKTPNPPLLVEGLDASSTLNDDTDPDRYSAAKVFDGDPRTAWVEDVDGGGEPEDPERGEVAGESITITFNQPLVFDAVEVMPGYFKGKYWALNNRVQEMYLRTGREIASIELKDEREAQRYELDHAVEAKTLTFELRSVYRGERWDDTPISEIALYRDGERIDLKGNLADADSPVRLSEDEWK